MGNILPPENIYGGTILLPGPSVGNILPPENIYGGNNISPVPSMGNNLPPENTCGNIIRPENGNGSTREEIDG
jgi:hypothetical protein